MKIFKLLLGCCIVSSCTSNTIYKAPDNLIPKDSMMLLLKDMYIASSAKNVKNKFSKREKNYMPLVYQKYKIDSLRFDISNTYYTSKVEMYEQMIMEIKKELQDDFSKFDTKLLKKDSLKAQKRITLKDSLSRKKQKLKTQYREQNEE